MMTSIKNIIFDLGGVVIDLDRARCVDSFTKIGFPEADSLIDMYHPADFFQSLERGEITVEELCDIIRHKAGDEKIQSEQICEAYSSFLVGIPQFKLRLIAALKAKGYKIYALSNINAVVMPRVREFFATDGRAMEDYFDKMYLSYEMGVLKPEPKIYEMLITDSGVVPSETLFIDDSTANIEAAREFGLNVYLAAAHEDYSHLFEL